ncbi:MULTISPECIES: GntR family transcriptional regulator [Streptomyces]|uniref:GntR family transcriptional regulator n=1 Tax=Streptomyces TaxID=1883 RepID=UPI00017EA107|nr:MULTISPECIES: GntR family transcriptional regulator [Streptomyces]AKL67113.1 GntR family transcriptional regulator [Streptomyces sp. Mg1]EDX24362.1 gntR-family regulator [Streptomyces sp. Mg1]RPK47802.1 putative HTH-type transcriptional regulator YurK [Streptomyces sp. ADI91-18]WBY21245.1 GntR family transcriptional regulator [Streptomyces goshikiensis]WSS00041.1 GntR family transcriptional regulator [Streptomyces goshikiensis]
MPREAPYLAVADVLRARILAGEWEIGERLPSRARLAVEYGVGRNVMQRAVDRLIIDGLLEGRAGSGTYLRMPRERLRLVRSRHHERQDRRERGRADAWDSHSQVRVPAPEPIAERLAISSGELCVHTHYEFLAEGQPVQLSASWEPMAITDGTPIVLPEQGPLAGKGVVERMRSIGVVISTVVEVPRPARATQRQANLLGISVGDLVLQIERTIFDTDGRPVETADMVIPDARREVVYEFGVGLP